MLQRRKFLELSSLGLSAITFSGFASKTHNPAGKKPIVISTWAEGLNANKAAWAVLKNGGRAIDAVEQGVMVTENSQNCCVGLGANPDRDGYVTLDACIMDEFSNCGSVAFLERIKHPISVARRVMEKTPHVMLVGSGAQQFAVAEGFPLESEKLSPDAERSYKKWLEKSEYKPVINIENSGNNLKSQSAFAPSKLENGNWNHDTIGMVALDANGNLKKYRYFNQNNTPANDQTYAFESLAVNMRGFIQNVANGNNALVLNSEFRLPVFSTLFNRPFNNKFIRDFQLTQFIDLGTAWNGAYNNLSRPIITVTDPNNPAILVKQKVGGVGPFAGGYGFGARSSLLGYFVKLDAAWTMKGFFRGKPQKVGQTIKMVVYQSYQLRCR